MLTAIATDDQTVARRPDAARNARDARRETFLHDLLDRFAELALAAEAAAGRAARH